jgi:hypothetical protein
MACSRSLVSAYADMPMIGMPRVCGSFLRRRTDSQRWPFKIHQNYVRALGHGQFATLLAVLGSKNLEIAKQLKPSLEHVKIVIVVFDIQYFNHSRSLFDRSSFDHLLGGTPG